MTVPGAATGAAVRRPRRFRLELWPALFTLVGLVVLLSLGTWQLRRWAWKQDLIARAEAGLQAPAAPLPAEPVEYAALDFRHLRARGTYRHEAAFGLGFSGSAGQAGANLVTPLVLEDDGRTLLVDRGWLPLDRLPPDVPDDLEPRGPVEVAGVVRYRADAARGYFQPADDPPARRWYAWDLAAMAEAVGAPLLPVVLVADPAPGPDGLPRATPVRVDYPDNHLGYAITWYGLAAGLLGTYLVFSHRQPDDGPHA